MTSFGKFTLRFAVYGVVMAYLVGDLFVFDGPLQRRLAAARLDSPESLADARRRGVAAHVFGREITLAQIDHAVRGRLAADGVAPGSVAGETMRLYRYGELINLIDHEILRVKVMHSASELPVVAADVDAEFARVAARFPGRERFLDALAESGTDEAAFRDRLAARIQQIDFVESRIAPLAAVSDDEIDAWPEDDAAADRRETAAAIDAIKRHRAVAGLRAATREFEVGRDRVVIHHEVLRSAGPLVAGD